MGAAITLPLTPLATPLIPLATPLAPWTDFARGTVSPGALAACSRVTTSPRASSSSSKSYKTYFRNIQGSVLFIFGFNQNSRGHLKKVF